jgi:hypothetical protein
MCRSPCFLLGGSRIVVLVVDKGIGIGMSYMIGNIFTKKYMIGNSWPDSVIKDFKLIQSLKSRKLISILRGFIFERINSTH